MLLEVEMRHYSFTEERKKFLARKLWRTAWREEDFGLGIFSGLILLGICGRV